MIEKKSPNEIRPIQITALGVCVVNNGVFAHRSGVQMMGDGTAGVDERCAVARYERIGGRHCGATVEGFEAILLSEHLLAEAFAHDRVEKRIEHAVQVGERVRERLEREQATVAVREAVDELHGE